MRFSIIMAILSMLMFTSCMTGDYEEVTLETWEEGQTFDLVPPFGAKKVIVDEASKDVHLRLSGKFIYGDQLIAYQDGNCLSNPIATVNVVHRDHALIKIPESQNTKGEIYLVNMRGTHATDCKRLKID